MKIKDILRYLEEGSKKKYIKNKKDIIKFFTPELMLRKKENGVEYEVSEIDMSDPDNATVKMFRYSLDGSKTENEEATAKEIESKFDIA